MAKARLSADISIPKHIDRGQLQILAIYPGEPTDEWKEDVKGMPANWKVGAWPDADRHFTMRLQPEIYFLNKDRKILVKDIVTDNLLNTFNRFIK